MPDLQTDPDYEECIVSFIDILGFRDLLNRSSAAEIRKVLRIFHRHSEADELMDSGERRLMSEVKTEVVSDAIVRARTIHTDYKDGALFHELLDLVFIQSLCLNQGILLRGALTIDYVHVGENMEGPVFGPGLVNAYLMEGREAVYPRIIVDEAVMKRFAEDRALWREGHSKCQEQRYVTQLLKSDEAGLGFVDYLRGIKTEVDHYGEYLEFLERHSNLIRQGLSSASRRDVRRKYAWLRNYHNKQVKQEMDTPNLDDPNPELDGATLRELLEPLVLS